MYVLWYKDYTRKSHRRKYVQIPGVFPDQAAAGRHMLYIRRKRLYNTGSWTILKAGHHPSVPARNIGYVQSFIVGRKG